MENRNNDIFTELNNISPAVANLTRNNIYFVSTDYFEGLSGEILSKIRLNNLLTAAKNNSYITPKGYFNELPENILQKILINKSHNPSFENELQAIAPTLSKIGKHNVFALPENYFDKKESQYLSYKKAKVINIFSGRKVALYAVAAMFLTILGIGIVKYISQSEKTVNVNTEVAKFTDDELNSFVNINNHVDVTTATVSTDEQEETNLFEAATTEELKQFLNQQAETAEINIEGS